MTTRSALVFDDVAVIRAGRRVLDGLTCTIPLAGVTVISGPSGAGKSTLLRLCNRLEVPASGRVLLDGVDLAGADPLVLRRRVGMVFQRPTPFAGTVTDNLLVGAPGLSESDVSALLARVGLPASFAARDATRLSGGEAQRVCLARTLAVRPRVLLLDEPTSALDPDSASAVEVAVAAMALGGIAVLWVTHDASQATRVGDRVVHLEAGTWIATTENTRCGP